MEKPLGIFDSGIGGLTVAKAISKVLPNERLIYFGDTAHLPYGDKSKDSIKLYSKRIAEYLIEKECKAIIIACNTASAHAYSDLVARFPNIPIINVIDPTVNFCSNNEHSKSIGVIATKGTIKSRIYPRKIKKKNDKLQVFQSATPLLAPMIEEGFFNNNISQTIINSYLSTKNFKDIDTLILACTHYPLIKDEVERFFNEEVDVVDSASVVANYVKSLLKELNIASNKKTKENLFCISDYTSSFEATSKIFFGEKIHLVEERIWD